jgi:hypothetical protein
MGATSASTGRPAPPISIRSKIDAPKLVAAQRRLERHVDSPCFSAARQREVANPRTSESRIEVGLRGYVLAIDLNQPALSRVTPTYPPFLVKNREPSPQRRIFFVCSNCGVTSNTFAMNRYHVASMGLESWSLEKAQPQAPLVAERGQRLLAVHDIVAGRQNA